MAEHASFSSENLPPELYREIVQHLHPRDDRHTLQNVSLVSPALRVEGQRMLFSMGPHTVQGGAARRAAEEVIKLKGVYTRFLSAILGDSENNVLAGYIREYKHYSTKTDKFQEDPVASSLMRALPMMHNLKSLHIDLHELEHTRMIELSQIAAAFQLHTLSIATPDRVAPFLLTTFLQTQPHLVHMDIIYRSGYLDAIESFAGILPRLISLRTDNVSLFERVALTHKIKALHLVGCHYLSPDTIATLRKIKYLRLTLMEPESGARPTLRSNMLIIPPGIDLKVDVLHLRLHGDIHQIIHNVTPQISRLRMLIASPHPDYNLTGATSFKLLFRRLAAIAFSRSSSLLYVVVPNDSPNSTRGGAYLYRRSAAVQTALGHGAGPVMEELEFDRDWSDKSRPYWWIDWEDILSGRSTLGLIHAPVVVDMSDKYSSDGLYSS